MKVLLVNFTDTGGGAARAAYRLHRGLLSARVSSQLVVQKKGCDDDTVQPPRTDIGQKMAQLRPSLSKSPLSLYRKRQPVEFSLEWIPDLFQQRIANLQPDVINLHWVNAGFLHVPTIAQLKQPVVWTLHDMWAFTGGCHYSQECDRYKAFCGACPQLGSQQSWDLSRWQWQRKYKYLRDAPLTVVTPSVWLAKCAQQSAIFRDTRVEAIPNGLDLQRYRPVERSLARKLLDLPQDKHLAVFSAIRATGDRRKGFHLLQPALKQLSQAGWGERLELVVMGASEPQNPPELGLKVHYLGSLHDDLSISLVYSAADVFVAPSMYDNLPNTLVEAIACGIPCVAFNVGGIADIIDHQQNGYLAQPYETQDLAHGLAWVLEDGDRHHRLSLSAREKAMSEFSIELQTQRYLALFEDVLAEHLTRKK